MSGADRVGLDVAVGAVTRREVRNAVRTCRAAEVTRVIGDGVSVEVRLCVGEWHEIGGGGREALTVEPTPPIPVAYQRSGRVVLVIPPRVGDVGLVHFRDVDHTAQDRGDNPQGDTPANSRRWNLADAIFVPSVGSLSEAVPASALRSDGAPVLDMDAGLVFRVGDGAATIKVARGDGTKARIEALETAFENHAHAAGTLTAPSGGGSVTGATAGIAYTAPTDVIESARLMVDG